jgi:hypothetical protein
MQPDPQGLQVDADMMTQPVLAVCGAVDLLARLPWFCDRGSQRLVKPGGLS